MSGWPIALPTGFGAHAFVRLGFTTHLASCCSRQLTLPGSRQLRAIAWQNEHNHMHVSYHLQLCFGACVQVYNVSLTSKLSNKEAESLAW